MERQSAVLRREGHDRFVWTLPQRLDPSPMSEPARLRATRTARS